MSLPSLPVGTSRRQLRKAVLRMRLEMHRQEMRHETLQLMEPLRQVRLGLRQGSAPLWLSGGALALAGLLGGRSGWRRWLRLALIAAPLLRRRRPATEE